MAKKSQGEIIWRLTYQIDATTDKERPEPVVLLLADRKGWLTLAKLFLEKAKRPIPADAVPSPDPDDHWHLGLRAPGVNAELSHSLEFRLGTIIPQMRADVLDKYRIRPPSKRDRDLRYLFRELLKNLQKEMSENGRMLKKSSKPRSQNIPDFEHQTALKDLRGPFDFMIAMTIKVRDTEKTKLVQLNTVKAQSLLVSDTGL